MTTKAVVESEDTVTMEQLYEVITVMTASLARIEAKADEHARKIDVVAESVETLNSTMGTAVSLPFAAQRETAAAPKSKLVTPTTPESITITDRPWKKNPNSLVALNTTSIHNAFKSICGLEANYPGSIRALAETILACRLGFSEGVKVVDWSKLPASKQKLRDYLTTPIHGLINALKTSAESTAAPESKRQGTLAKQQINETVNTTVEAFRGAPQALASLFQRTGSGGTETPYDMEAKTTAKKLCLFDSYLGWAWYLRLPTETRERLSPPTISPDQPVPLYKIDKRASTSRTAVRTLDDIDPDAAVFS